MDKQQSRDLAIQQMADEVSNSTPRDAARTGDAVRASGIAPHVQQMSEALGLPIDAGRAVDAASSAAGRLAFTRALEEAERGPARYEELPVESLADALKRPEEPMEQRIESLLYADHNTTIAAAAKTGKTTLMVNLTRSLVDGTPFLDRYAVSAPVAGSLAFWNYELSERQMLAWFRDARISRPDRVRLLNLRGRGLYLQDDIACEWAVEWLRASETEVWVIDPLQAALRGTVNSDEVAAEWISRVEQVKSEAGVRDLIVVTHTGHLSKKDETGRSDNERTIGSARWMGWPDNMWVYVKDEDDVRYLRGEGRDTTFDEFGLDFDRPSMTLTWKGDGTGRHDQRVNAPWRSLIELFEADPAATYTGEVLLRRMSGRGNGPKIDARRQAEEMGMLEEVADPAGSKKKAYRLTDTGRWALKQGASN